MRVLLVDDEMELVSALAERLGFRGVEADFATTAEEALKLVRAKTYDIAVLDVKMPGMGGLELQQHIHGIQPDLLSVFVTGHGSAHDFEAGTERASAYLVKPVSIDDLLETFDRVLDRTAKGE